MNKQALSLAVCIAGAYPLSAGAIGLGDIRSNSHLNQPLSAKIELLSTSTQEAKQVQVRLASADVFNRVGIDRPAYLNSLQFTPTVQGGKPVILVSSSQPIKEPFLNFLLEVSWPKGQLLKEYTVLLDPPVLLQSGNTSDRNTAAVRAEPKAAGFVQRPKQAPRQQTRNQQQVQVRDGIKLNATPAPVQQAAPSSSSKRKYRVNSGDTLYKIAARVKPRGVTADQMMVALFRANPDAFRRHNINRLKAGETLKVPSTAESKAISSTRAKRVIRKHYAEWKQYRKKLAGKTVPQKQTKASSRSHKGTASSKIHAKNKDGKAHLEVMGSKSSSSAKSSSKVSAAGQARITELEKQLSLAQEALVSKRRENADLKSRISDMQSIIQKKDRLISLKSSQLAKLQQSLAAGKAKNTTNNANTAANATPTPTPVNTDLSAHIANTTKQAEGRINRTQPNSTTAPVATPAPNKQPNKAPNTPQAHQNDLSAATLPAKRREAAMAENNKENNTPEDTGFKPEKENALLSLLSSPIVTAAGAGSILLLLLGWLLLSRRKNKAPDDGAALQSSDDILDDDFTSLEDDINSNTDDVTAVNSTADDDFFKDFGDELNSAEADNPVVTGETPETSDVSTAMDTEEDDDILQEADVYIVYGLHEQAEAELRKAINDNPDKLEYRHKLLENYLASNNKEAFDTQAAELAKIEGKNKDAIWAKVVEMGRKISPDNVLYQVTDGSSEESSSTTGVVAAATAATAVAAAAMSTDSDDEPSSDDSNSDISDDTDLDLDDLLLDDKASEPVTEEQVEASVTEVKSSDFDDLDDDFSDFGLDDESFSLDELEKELDDQSTDLSNSEVEESNVIDFESMLLDESQEDNSAEDDLALANLNLNVDESTGIDRILPQDTAYTAQGNTSELGNEEDDVLSFLDLPEEDIDLHEAHISTKLDLARAYLDMGDVEGARSTLEEVIVEGSDDQKREAEDLLHQTG